MNFSNLLEVVDLDIVRDISPQEAYEFKILPIYSDNNYIYVVTIHKNRKGEELLNFIYKKKIIYIEKNENELMQLMKILLDYKEEKLEIKVIEEAIISKVSDIHFEPIGEELKIRMRINGSLILTRILKQLEYNQIISRLKINSGMDIAEKRMPQDGKMNFLFNNVNYSLRLSTIPVVEGEKLVIRILYEDKNLSSIENLKLSERQLKNLKKIISVKNGLVVVNGPTGSGKSTTLYSILNFIKEESINITTLEDPIEVNIKGINQINLNSKIGITFSTGLRSILRQDPDVIMVGEIRDEETAKMAIRASITGHKVYSTIHTKNPREVYLRLEEMGVESYLIRDSLCGIISQRLIKVLCNRCKEKLRHISVDNRVVTLYKRCGCNNCNGTGYVGRKLVASINYINKDIVKSLKKIHENEDLLSNKEMGIVLKELLINGEIDFYDYLDFIEGEELNEEILQELRIDM